MSELAGERLDALLAQLAEAGFQAPYGVADVNLYIRSPTDPPPGPEREAALAKLREVDEQCHQLNRDALRAALR